MKTNRLSPNLSVLIVMLSLVGVIAYQASARRPAVASPTVVVTVNRSAVLDGINERAAAQATLVQMSEELKTEQDNRDAEIKNLQAQYESATNDGDRARLLREIEEKTLKFRGFVQFANVRLDVERALLFESLYRNISSAIDQMAQAEGYDIVLVDDVRGEFAPFNPQMQMSREDQIKQQIANRRIMYANPTVDITEALIIRMNNAFEAG